MSDISQFMESVGEAYAQQKKLVKSDDIIDFIKTNWRFFCSNRNEMKNALDMLGVQVPYTVDALCDQLGIPSNVFFKRSPVKDVSGALLKFGDSKYMELFLKCCQNSDNGEACVFVVAGKHSIVITNMQTSFNPGELIMYYKSAGDHADIHIFPYADAPSRMPNLFYHNE
jgi:hypothetical protein